MGLVNVDCVLFDKHGIVTVIARGIIVILLFQHVGYPRQRPAGQYSRTEGGVTM